MSALSYNSKNLYHSKIFIAVSIILYSNNANTKDVFDINAINTGIESQIADVNSLDYLSYSGGQVPGNYHVDIYVNDKFVDEQHLRFIFDEHNKKLSPLISKKMLLSWGVKKTASQAFSNINDEDKVTDISATIPGASYSYDFGNSRLKISIPQIGLDNYSRGYVDPNEWDDGINAAFVNYNIRHNQNWYKDRDDTNNTFVGLRSGINVGAWRLRNHSNYSRTSNESHWNNLQTYIERDIRSLKSHLTIGETASDNGVMESNPYRGIKLASDESMLPQSQRGFAPVVQGIAQTNAVVTIRQNGSVIYQTTVPPGEFEINDLYPTSYSGDLEVQIEEANGTIRSFIQPFSAVPMMQRAGALKYSVDIGKYNADNAYRKPNFAQASAIYGLPYNLSIYGGFILSKDYQAYTAGTGINLGNIGAISADITQSKTELIDKKEAQGQSYRVQYSKYLPGTGTSFSLASYRYSTKEYYDFSSSNNDLYASGRKKQQFQASISQSLKDMGYLSLNGYQQYYWDRSGVDKNLTIGFNSNYQQINYGISYSYTKQEYTNNNNEMLSVNFSIPFTIGQKNNWVNYRYNTSRNGDSISSVSVSGTRLADNNLQFDVTQNYNHSRHENSGSVSGNYVVSSGEYSAGYSYDPRYQNANLGASGALLLHSGGVTAARNIYDSAILVKAKNINNLQVNNAQALYTDSWGYAVVPSATRYERNKISVDPSTLTGNNDVGLSTTTVVPTRGAIVLADFKGKRGARVMLKLTHHQQLIPFGAQVTVFVDKDEITTGIVANDGEVYLSGVPEQSLIRVQWGSHIEQQCQFPLTIDLNNDKIQFLARDCQ
ncbi:fimbria/pilus outer membrane usher protein [Providencia stuartii]|uniref:fimbria/pilus outer membrane usher protein n=1 Tax=Providencia stuartii TaxID=588 RepID=UPI0018C4A380|nr:fimbria/pilus outer membrane usher protein [Providencia stuartii]MBG5918216.1 fimbrial biogenesis outer membrane usher protein [Providencia stuartii]